MNDSLVIAGRAFRSRLIVGTGKYRSFQEMARADEAIRAARLGREVGLSNWVKLEVIGDQQTLFPDTEELVNATRVLVKEGFVVLPYTSDDLIVARKLIDAGAAAVMPLGAPIGSGLCIQYHDNLRYLSDRVTEVTLILDAGVGTASDAAVPIEL